MKVLIIICAVLLLLQFGVLGLGFATGGGEQPTEEQIEDGDWDPEGKVPVAAGFEQLLEPFRPRLELPWKQKSFPAGTMQQVTFGNGHEDRRVAKFELTGGDGVLIRYECSNIGKGYRCPQVACLCRPGAAIDSQELAACDGSPPGCLPEGEIVVYSETGTLEFSGMGNAGGTVRQR